MTDNLRGIQRTEENEIGWRPTDDLELDLGNMPAVADTSEASSSQPGAANEYTDKIVEAVTQAKDYLGEKASAVGGKIKDFATDDLSGMANKAKDFARQNPGQAILVSAGVGLLLGLIVRGRR